MNRESKIKVILPSVGSMNFIKYNGNGKCTLKKQSSKQLIDVAKLSTKPPLMFALFYHSIILFYHFI